MNSSCLTQYVITKITVTLVIYLTMLPFFITAQAKPINSFHQFNEDNLLSYQVIGSIAQDRDGFMWFGSQDGLHRYDGHNFKSFNYSADDRNSLSSNAITGIFVDSVARIWVGTRGGGLNLLLPNHKDFLRFNSKNKTLSLADDNITSILEDELGQLWVATQNGLHILSFTEQQWQIKRIDQQTTNSASLSNSNVQALVKVPDGNIWAATLGSGINVFNQEGKFIRTFHPEGLDKNASQSLMVNTMMADAEGNIWLGTSSTGLIKFDHISNDFLYFRFSPQDSNSLASDTIEAVQEDTLGRIWVATDKGLSIYDKKSGNFFRYNHKVNDPYSLSNDFVLTFFEDSNKVMWVGTFSGVNFFDPNTTSFRQHNSARYEQLKNNHISSFTQTDEQSLYISTYDGVIYQLNLLDDTLKPINIGRVFKDKSIMKLFADEDTLWVGTRLSGLYKINLSDNSVTNYRHDRNDDSTLSNNSVTDIVKDVHGHIWISTFHRGINRLNQNGTFTRFDKQPDNPEKGPSTGQILQLLTDHMGTLWLATFDRGINRFDPITKTFTHLRNDETDNTSISSDIAWIIFLDDDKNLWVGTQGEGLNILQREDLETNNYTFKHLSQRDGMNTQTVYGISQDSRGDIWYSSNKGFSRYSPKYRSFKHFDTTHGLMGMEFNHGAVYRSADKTIYFGSPLGFNSVESENVLDSRPAPEVRLTNIFKLNEPMIFNKPLSEVDNLIFSYKDQIISFEYVGLDYINPSSTKYRYRLQGLDDEWIDARTLKRATYTNLPARDYVFQVVAGNNDNVWSDPGLQFKFTVEPAPWNTWWAYLLYSMLIALSLLIYSRQVNRKLIIEQQQKIQLKQEVEEKTREFQEKNIELEQANKQLENAATTDKVTGVKSRRYLDIYIEQASRLMAQIHENILPVQRSVLPRLYLLMVRISDMRQVTNSQLVNLTDLLLYSRNPDDLVIRWSEDIFAVIGYEKEHNARELANRLKDRFNPIFEGNTKVDMAYSFYPFSFEQPMAISWDQVSVLTESGLNRVSENDDIKWIGLHGPKEQPFNYLESLRLNSLSDLSQLIDMRQG